MIYSPRNRLSSTAGRYVAHLGHRKSVSPGLSAKAFSYLDSRIGGVQQGPHQGYSWEDLERGRRGDTLPACVLPAFQPDTRLTVDTGCFDVRRPGRERLISILIGYAIFFEVI